jgi:hypothetical protein
MKGKAHTPTSMDMKKYGRNVARAMNQTGGAVYGKKTPDGVKTVDASAYDLKPVADKGIQKAPNEAIVANEGSPKKATKIRGTGAATKGIMARGPMG